MSNQPCLLDKLEAYLFGHFEFRFNVLAEQTEFCEKGKSDFRLVDQRVLNTLCLKARKEGINCWDKDVTRLLMSQQIADFHPFSDYVEKLPEWDGVDRVSELARRVSDASVCERFPPMDVGHGGAMDEAGRSMCQCDGSFID